MFLLEFLKLWIKMHTCIPVISKISVKTHRISYFSKVLENVHDILKNIGSSFFFVNSEDKSNKHQDCS